jgi:hypothetical protein
VADVAESRREFAPSGTIPILEYREAKINEMISKKEEPTKIMTKIQSLKNYSDKNPSNFNLESALTNFSKKGFTLNGNTTKLAGEKQATNFLTRMNQNIKRRNEKLKSNVKSNVSNTGLSHNNKSTQAIKNLPKRAWRGGNKEYINLQSGGRRLIRYGSRGGRYYMKGGNKHYLR